jgi:type IV secretion system protein VirB9
MRIVLAILPVALRATLRVALLTTLVTLCAQAATLPAKGHTDERIRIAAYDPDQVYRIHGYVGYQVDLQFETGEQFVGLGAGDIDGLAFTAQDNHLFLKPKAATVGTNLTVLTNRHHYHFDYTASARRPDPDVDDVIYSLRFTYPLERKLSADLDEEAGRVDAALAAASTHRPRNIDYWYCGRESIRPVAASDDGIHTRLRFAGKSELPAIFIRNDDGTESLLNFSFEGGDLIIHRVARQFILRRGRLTGCIVNKAFAGTADRLATGTVTPDVERKTKGPSP